MSGRESGWSVKAIDSGHQTRPRANTHHCLQGCMISKAEWATPGSKHSNWFSVTLALGSVMSCIRRRGWRQVTWFQILTPPFLAVSSQANHWNPLSPSFFFLPTYLSIYPSTHLLSSSITAGCGKEEKRKYKEGNTLKTANAQINSNGQVLRTKA